MMKDEWYSFTKSPRANGSHILATLDESTYDPVFMGGKSLRMGDHPIAWSRCIGQGHMVYSAIGHRPEVYDDPVYRRMLTNAIAWAVNGHGRPC
jgi:type 1 glutamine amidotransferase